MGEYPGGMGTGNGCFEGMSGFRSAVLLDEDVADDRLPKHQKKTSLPSASEHNYMEFIDPYCSIVRQGKSLLSTTSIDSFTT